MYKLGARSRKLHWLSSKLSIFLPIFFAFIQWLDSSHVTFWLKAHPTIAKYVQYFLSMQIEILATLGTLWIFSILYRKLGDPWVVDLIKFVLNEYQNNAFEVTPEKNQIPKDHNRITIFRYSTGLYLFSKKPFSWKNYKKIKFKERYLAPVLRSGEQSQNSQALFLVTDDSDTTQGVAGRTWCMQQAMTINKLPDVLGDGKTSRSNYAAKSFCTLEIIDRHIQEKKPMPRSISAIPLERKGKPWGVIVLDSRYPNGVTERAIDEYRLTVSFISQLLEKVR